MKLGCINPYADKIRCVFVKSDVCLNVAVKKYGMLVPVRTSVDLRRRNK